MERGYLFILVGILIIMPLFIPLPLPDESLLIWRRFLNWGYFMIAMGLMNTGTAFKELKSARFFTLATLIIGIALPHVPRMMFFNLSMALIFTILYAFFSAGIFFWILKAEYMWSPSRSNRIDLLIYSLVAIVYLMARIMVVLPLFIAMTVNTFETLSNLLEAVSIFYYIVLIFLFAKLYFAARNDRSGMQQWN